MKRIIITPQKNHAWKEEGRRNRGYAGVIKCAYIKENPNFLSKDCAKLSILHQI
jgi:hypothetical protein